MLNNRQKSLYNLLLDKATTHYLSKEEICKSLNELYKRHLEKTSEHNSIAYSLIRNDVKKLNQSDVEHIIVSSKKGYKVANKEEAVEFIKRRFKRDFASLKTNWNLNRKIGLDGQLNLDLKEVETFIKGNNNG